MSDDDKKPDDANEEEASKDEKPSDETGSDEGSGDAGGEDEPEEEEKSEDKGENDGGGSGETEKAGMDQQGRQLYKTKCSDCGNDTEVPFKPSGDRPVYCRDCFMKKRG